MTLDQQIILSSARRVVGKRIPRREDPKLVRGVGSFIDDLRLPNMLHAKIARSPYAHAIIRSVDTSRAASKPGVVAIITGQDALAMSSAWGATDQFPFNDDFAMATTKALFVGHEIAAVAAFDKATAEDAVELIDVEYEPLPAVMDGEDALRSDSWVIHESGPTFSGIDSRNVHSKMVLEAGDVDRAFRNADAIVGRDFHFSRPTAGYMEPAACIALYEPVEGNLTLWNQSQWPHLHRQWLASVLGLPMSKVRVVVKDVGGSFGVKSEFLHHEIITCLLSMRTGRPVKIVLDRTEDMLATRHRFTQTRHPELALSKDGKILAWREKMVWDGGALAGLCRNGMTKTSTHIVGCYKIDNIKIEGLGVYTNKCAGSPVRGFGEVQLTYVREVMLDIAARSLKLDPVEFRLRNMIKPEELPYTTSTGMHFDSGSFTEALKQAVDAINVRYWRERQKEDPSIGIGFANVTKHSGTRIGDAELDSVELTVLLDGSLVANVSCEPAGGLGHETMVSQLLSEELGVDMEKIQVVHGDTQDTPFGFGTFGTRTATLTSSTVHFAAQKLKQKMLGIFAYVNNQRIDNVDLAEGKLFVSTDRSKSMTFAQIAKLAYMQPKRLPPGEEIGLSVRVTFDPMTDPVDERGKGNLSITYANATHGAVVRVDRESGKVALLDYVVVYDSGRIINPLLAEGQVAGGVVQGAGITMFEELPYDRTGQLLAPTFMDYLLLTSVDSPDCIKMICRETPSTTVVTGVKGVAQSGIMGAPPAISNAIADCIGKNFTDLPITPEMITRGFRPSS